MTYAVACSMPTSTWCVDFKPGDTDQNGDSRWGRECSGSGTSHTVTISSITGNGTLGISIAGGTASDKAGNLARLRPPARCSRSIPLLQPWRRFTLRGDHSERTRGLHNYVCRLQLQRQHARGGERHVERHGDSHGNGERVRQRQHEPLPSRALPGREPWAFAGGPKPRWTAGNLAHPRLDQAACSPSIHRVGGDQRASTRSRSGPVTYAVTFSDLKSRLCSGSVAAGDVTLNATGTYRRDVGVSGTGNTRTVTISGISGNGTLGISVAAGIVVNSAGHPSAAGGKRNLQR